MSAWWYDHHDDIVTRARVALRLHDDTDPDVATVDREAITAGQMIDARLDRCTPLPQPTPGPILDAAVETTINLYRRSSAPFGTVGGFAENSASPTPIYADPLEGVYPMIIPWRERWGVA